MISPAFHPLPALVGGLMIGVSAASLLWLNGRIAGISGIVQGSLAPRSGDIGWRLVFIAGLAIGGALGAILAPQSAIGQAIASPPMLALAGVLVGVGTAHAWDPSLAFTMAGALAVTFVSFPLIRRKGRALLDALHLPTRRDIDPPLLFGSALFGIGWGLGGYCPGPAIASLPINPREAGVFVVAMVVGMLAKRALAARAPAPT